MLRILCFGDSITLGEKDTSKGGWVDRLKTYYFERYKHSSRQLVSVFNLGIGGETTDGLAGRFKAEFDARHIKGQNSVVILAYGSNDIVIHKEKNIVPETYFVRNLKSCIEYAKNLKAKVVLLSLLPVSDDSDNHENQYGHVRREKDICYYNQVLEAIGKKESCYYFDIYSLLCEKGKKEMLAEDGLHPNAHGHQIIYQAIKEELDSIFTTKLIT